jgi:hypothetical protein
VGPAANGQAGVENVLDVLRNGVDSALLGLGKSSVHDLTREDVIIPPDSCAASAASRQRIIAGASAIMLPAGRQRGGELSPGA